MQDRKEQQRRIRLTMTNVVCHSKIILNINNVNFAGVIGSSFKNSLSDEFNDYMNETTIKLLIR